jgi:hypothetical protein
VEREARGARGWSKTARRLVEGVCVVEAAETDWIDLARKLQLD